MDALETDALSESRSWSIDDENERLALDLRLEHVAAKAAFDEVLETAIETCLRDPHAYEAAMKAIAVANQQTDSPESSLVEKLGLWGLKAHVDYTDNAASFYTDAMNDLPPPLMQDVLTQPELVPLRPDNDVQNKIEAFGMALIDEAFSCLGTDAFEKAEAFAAAEADEQYEILLWLYERIARIRDMRPEGVKPEETPLEQVMADAGIQLVSAEPIDEDAISSEPIVIDFRDNTLDEVSEVVDTLLEETEIAPDDRNEENPDQYFYHPVRLSPKVIGQYPELHTKTTCLGISMLAVAFFAKAGATYLHAGVMETAEDATRMTQLYSIYETEYFAEQNSVGFNDKADAAMVSIEKAINKMRRTDRGHHAVAMVKLQDGDWVIFDPNYNALDRLKEYDSKLLQKAYDQLESLETVDRGSAQIIRMYEGMYAATYLTMIRDMDTKKPEDIAPLVDDIMAADDIVEAYKDYLISAIADLPFIDTMVDLQTAFTNYRKERYADVILQAVIDKYALLDGMTQDDIKSRYASDAAFRARRIEDAMLLPHMTIMKLLSEYAHLQRAGLHAPPATIEAGLPAFRIGACVLSDFALYTGNQVPLSFWVANWTSHVAVEGHLPAKNDETAQARLGRRLSSIIRSGVLRNFGSYGIIHRFLEQGVNKTDGNQQG